MADNIEPISHLEKVITGDVEPISHLEWIIATYGGSGSGSGGTTNYNALLNKPSINGVTLTGNKTLADLGITNYNNDKLTGLKDVDTTNIGDGKTLVYDAATQKHKYVDSIGTDELVKMDSTTDAKHLSDLIDKQTIVNDNGVLKVKKLDGQNVTIAEINHLKGLTMNVMDLFNTLANGGVKVLNTPVNSYADLLALDRSKFVDGVKYFVYVQSDENHSGAKTVYLCDKTSSTFFGNADSQRNFITDPIDLANEVTGKLGASNIDVDALLKLLTINNTYKTLTTKNEPFGTHGAKALYDELVTSIGKKANATDLTTHTSDTNIHVTTADKTKWDGYSTTINNMRTNFQAGVNTIYNSVVAKGVTPTDKSPSSISSAINSIVSSFSTLKATARGNIAAKSSIAINFSVSTMYILICTLKYADTNVDRWAVYFIKNGIRNNIYYNSSSYTDCSISGNSINVTNKHTTLTSGYILLEFVV